VVTDFITGLRRGWDIALVLAVPILVAAFAWQSRAAANALSRADTLAGEVRVLDSLVAVERGRARTDSLVAVARTREAERVRDSLALARADTERRVRSARRAGQDAADALRTTLTAAQDSLMAVHLAADSTERAAYVEQVATADSVASTWRGQWEDVTRELGSERRLREAQERARAAANAEIEALRRAVDPGPLDRLRAAVVPLAVGVLVGVAVR